MSRHLYEYSNAKRAPRWCVVPIQLAIAIGVAHGLTGCSTLDDFLRVLRGADDVPIQPVPETVKVTFPVTPRNLPNDIPTALLPTSTTERDSAS